jgi:hypothetical protein
MGLFNFLRPEPFAATLVPALEVVQPHRFGSLLFSKTDGVDVMFTC